MVVRKRHVIAGICVVAMALVLAYAANMTGEFNPLSILLQSSLTTDKEVYSTGEPITITLEAPDEALTTLTIEEPNATFTALEGNAGGFSYSYATTTPGNYSASSELSLLNESMLLVTGFSVLQGEPPEEPPEEPAENDTSPANETIPSNQTEQPPANETEIPSNETEQPPANRTIPSNETEFPENETEIPSNQTEQPLANETIPSNQTEEPPANETIPSNETEQPVPRQLLETALSVSEEAILPRESVIIRLSADPEVRIKTSIIYPDGSSHPLGASHGDTTYAFASNETGQYSVQAFLAYEEETMVLSTGFVILPSNMSTANATRPANITQNLTNQTPLNKTLEMKGLSARLLDSRGDEMGRFALVNRTDGRFDLRITHPGAAAPAGMMAMAEEVPAAPAPFSLDIRGITALDREPVIRLGEVPDGGIKTDVVYVEEMDFEDAEVTLPKRGRITSIARCRDFDTTSFECSAWEPVSIPFTDNGDSITFTVDSFSAYGGAGIKILNTQSYPKAGGNWTVKFETWGRSNLTVTPVNGTTWSDSDESQQLRFLEVRCGDEALDYDWIDDGPYNSRVFVEDYECDGIGYLVSKVVRAGKHHLEFEFGGQTAQAHNSNQNRYRIQYGTGTFTDGQSTDTATLGISVDQSRAFIVFTLTGDSGAADAAEHLMNARFTADDTITFTRGETGDTPSWSYYVIEALDEQFEVQRPAQMNLAASAATDTEDITTPVDLDYTMVVGSCTAGSSGTADIQDGNVRFNMSDTDTVYAARDSAATGVSAACYAEVVEWSSSFISRVYHGVHQSTSSSFTYDDIGATVDMSSSFVYGTWSSASNGLEQTFPAIALTSSTQIGARTYDANYVNDISWFVVANISDASVQRSSWDWDPGASDYTRDETVTSIARNKTAVFSYGATAGDGTAFPRNRWTNYFTSATNLRFEFEHPNSGTVDARREYYQVVTFPNITSSGPASIEWNWTSGDGHNSTPAFNTTTICVNASADVNCTIFFNGTAYPNGTIGTNICWNFTNMPNGNYSTINATCNDSSSNRVNTTNAWWNVSQQPPTGSYNWAAANQSTWYNSTTICYETSTPMNCTLYFNGTNYPNSTVGLESCWNQTNKPTGNYSTINVTCEGSYVQSSNSWWYVTNDDPPVYINMTAKPNPVSSTPNNISVSGGVSQGGNMQTNHTIWIWLNDTMLNDTTLVNDTVHSPEWWNYTWRRRKKITIKETNSETRAREPVVVNLTGLTISNCWNELRLINSSGDEVRIDFISEDITSAQGSRSCIFAFLENISASGSDDYYAYYDNPDATEPSYPAVILHYDTFESYDQGADLHWASTGWGGGHYEANEYSGAHDKGINITSTGNHVYFLGCNGSTCGSDGNRWPSFDIKGGHYDTMDDYTMDVRFMSLDNPGDENGNIGGTVRYYGVTGNGCYPAYHVWWDEWNTYRIYEKYDGGACPEGDLDSNSFTGGENVWYHLQVDVVGNSIEADLDFGTSVTSGSAANVPYGSANMFAWDQMAMWVDNWSVWNGSVQIYEVPLNVTQGAHSEEYYLQTNGTGYYNYTFSSPTFEGNHTITVNATINPTGENSTNLTVDTTPPTIDWNWTNINTTISIKTTTVCINASEQVNCTLFFNGTNTASTGMKTYVCWPKSALGDGNYSSVNVSCDDIAGFDANTSNSWLNVSYEEPVQIPLFFNESPISGGSNVEVYGNVSYLGAYAENHTIYIYVDEILLNDTNLVTDDVHSPSWWNYTWHMRKNFTLEETTGTAREKEAMILNVSGLNITNCTKELRLINSTGEERAIEVVRHNVERAMGEKWCLIAFVENFTASQTKEFFIYYNNSEAADPGYPTLVYHYDDFEERTVGSTLNNVKTGYGGANGYYSLWGVTWPTQAGNVTAFGDPGNQVYWMGCNAASGCGGNYPKLVFNGDYYADLEDYTVEGRVYRIDNPSDDSGHAGFSLRYNNDGDCYDEYIMMMAETYSETYIWEKSGDQPSCVDASVDSDLHSTTTDHWYHLTAKTIGNWQWAAVNFTDSIVSATDTSIDSGTILLNSMNEGSNYFDDLIVWKGNVTVSETEPTLTLGAPIHFLSTDDSGKFNYTFISPASQGLHEVVVNTTYTIYGRNATNLSVLDETPPVITWIWPYVNRSTAQNSTTVNISVNENVNCTLHANITGVEKAYPNDTVGTYISWNFTNLPDGNYTFNVTCNDSASNKANSTNAWWRVAYYDDSGPTPTWSWADANSTIGVTYTQPCVTLSEPGNCTLHFNGTDYVNVTYASSICWFVTGLSQGNHSIVNVTCDDALGNDENSTNQWLDVSVNDNVKPNVSVVSPAPGSNFCSEVLINVSINDSVSGISTAYYRLSNASGWVTSWTALELSRGNIYQGYWNATFDYSGIRFGRYNVTINATDLSDNRNDTVESEFIRPSTIVWDDRDSSGTDTINDTVSIYNEHLNLTFRFHNFTTGSSANGYLIDTLQYYGQTLLENTPYYDQGKINELVDDGLINRNFVFGTTHVMGDLDDPDDFLRLWAGTASNYNLHTKSNITGYGCVLNLSTPSRTMGTQTLGTQTNFTVFYNDTLRVVDTVINKGSTTDVTRLIVFPTPRVLVTTFSEPENRNNHPYGPNYVRNVPAVAYSDDYIAYTTKYGSNHAGSGTLKLDAMTGNNPPWGDETKTNYYPSMYVMNTTLGMSSNEESTVSVDLVLEQKNLSDYYAEYMAENDISFDSFDYAKIRDYFTNQLRLDDCFHNDGFVIAAYYSDESYAPAGESDWSNMLLARSLMAMYHKTGDDYYLDKSKHFNIYLNDTLSHRDRSTSDYRYGYFIDATRPGAMIEWYKDDTAYMWSQPYQLSGLIAEFMATQNHTTLDVAMDNMENVFGRDAAQDGGLWNLTEKRWKWLIQKGSSSDCVGSNCEVDEDNYDSQLFGINVMLQAYMLTHNETYLERAQNVTNDYVYRFIRPTWQFEDTRKVHSSNMVAYTAKTLYLLYDITENRTYERWAEDLVDNFMYGYIYMDKFPEHYSWLKGGATRFTHDWQGRAIPDSKGDSGIFSEYNMLPWLQEGLIAAYKHSGEEIYLNFSKQILTHIKTSDAINDSSRMVDYFENENVTWTPSDGTSSVGFSTTEKQRDLKSLEWNFTQSGSDNNLKYISRPVTGTYTGGGDNAFADWEEFDDLTFWFYTTDVGGTNYYVSLKNSGSWVMDKYDFSTQLSSGWSFVEIAMGATSRGNVQTINFSIDGNDFGTGTHTFLIDDLKINKTRTSNQSSEYNAYTDLWYDYDNGQTLVGNLFVVAELGTMINGSRVEQSELMLFDKDTYMQVYNVFNNHTFNATLHLRRNFSDAWNANRSELTAFTDDFGNVTIGPNDDVYLLNATFILEEERPAGNDNTTYLYDEVDQVLDSSVDIYINSSTSVKTGSAHNLSIDSHAISNIVLNTTKFNMTFEPYSFNFTSHNGNFDVQEINECSGPVTQTCFSYVQDGSVYNVTVYNLTIEPGTGSNNLTHVGPDTTKPTLEWNWTDINSTLTDRNHTKICVNSTETINCTLHFEGTDYVNDTPSMHVCWHRTGLANANHTPINVTCDDTSENDQNTTNAWIRIAIGELSECAELGNSGWTYNLVSDVTSKDTCFNVTADDVTLNCSGHTITGDQSGYGVNATSVLDLTLRNCQITNFTRAIHAYSTNSSLFDNNTLYENNGTYSAFYVYGSNHNAFYNHEIYANNASDSPGFYLYASSNNTIQNATLANNTFEPGFAGGALSLYIAENNTISNLTFDNNTATSSGIFGGGILGLSDDCNNNTFSSLTFTNNTLDAGSHAVQGGGIIGIEPEGGTRSENNTFTDITLIENSVSCGSIAGGGIIGLHKGTASADNSTFTDLTLRNNSVSANGITGGGIIGIFYSDRNTFTTLALANNTVTATGSIDGGGILGLYAADNNTFNTVTFTKNTPSVAGSGYIYGGGILGLNSADNNSLSTINIHNNTATSDGDFYGGAILGLDTADDNVLTSISIKNNSASAASFMDGGFAIGLYDDSDTNSFTHMLLYNNTASALDFGGTIGLSAADNNTFTNATISLTDISVSLLIGGIFGLIDSNGNQFSNSTIYDNTIDSGDENSTIGLETVGGCGDNTFTNLNATGDADYMIYDDTGDSYVNYFTYSNAHGIINWTNTSDSGFLKNLTLKGNLTFGTVDATSKNILINNNTAFVNTSAFSLGQINSEANITLYELDEWSFSNPAILRNGVVCDDDTTPSCHNYTALDAATVIFNVSAWSNYTIGEGPTTELSDCAELDQADTEYTIVSNIVTDHTCFNITASGVTLNAAGHTVTGDGGEGDYCVNATGSLTNVTVKNFADINTWHIGVYFNDVDDSLIANSTFTSEISAGSNVYGIYMDSSDSVNVTNNTMSLTHTGAIGDTYGVGSNSGTGNNITNNTIVLTATYDAGGVYLWGTSSSNNIQNNSITVTEAVSYGRGIYLSGAESTTVRDNRINIDDVSTATAYGIEAGNSPTSNVIENNTIRAVSSNDGGSSVSSAGIGLIGADDFNITNNSITATASSARAADVYLLGSDGNNITGNAYHSDQLGAYVGTTSDGNKLGGTFEGAVGVEMNAEGMTAYLHGDSTFTGHGINITTDDTIVDGSSYGMTGDGSGSDYGVHAKARLNVTVRDFGDIDSFKRGVSFNRINDSKISNNNMTSSFGAETHAVHLTDSDSVDIKNNSIDWTKTGSTEYSYAVYIYINSGRTAGSNNITNNTLTSSVDSDAYAYGVYIYISNDGISNSNTISDNDFSSSSSAYEADGWTYGIEISCSGTMNSNTISENAISVSGANPTGVSIYNSGTMNSNTISDNFFSDIYGAFSSSYSYGLYLSNDGTMNSNNVSDNYLSVTSLATTSDLTAYGAFLDSVDYLNFSGNTLSMSATNSRSAGIYLSGADYGHFWNNSDTTSNYSLYIASGSGNTFWNNTFSGAYNTEINDLSGAGDTNYFHYRNSHGIINWTSTAFHQDLSTKGDLTFGQSDSSAHNIIIGNNTAYLAPAFTSPYDGINSTANITLYELDEWSISNRVILRNGELCDETTFPVCTAYTSLDADPVIFSVSAWSNYTIGENPGVLSDCANLNAAGEYSLSADVEAATTCFNVTADDVTLDCGAHIITGNQAGYGVNSTGVQDFTLRNCRITNFTRAIHAYSTNSSSFENNTLYENNGDYAGFYVYGSEDNAFYNHGFKDNAGLISSDICLNISHNSTFENTTIWNGSVSGANDLYGGVIALNSSKNNTFTNTTLRNGSVSCSNDLYGGVLSLRSSDNNTFSSVTIGGSSATPSASIYDGGAILVLSHSDLNTFSNTVLSNNTVASALDFNGGGILGLRTSHGNEFTTTTLHNNTARNTGGSIYGGGILGLYTGADNNTFTTVTLTNNSVSASGTISGGGILGLYTGADNNTLTGLTFTNNTASADGYIYGGGILGLRNEVNNNTLATVVFTNNSASAGSFFYGGLIMGLYFKCSNNTFSNLDFKSNAVSDGNGFDGGSMLGISSGEADIRNNSFTDATFENNSLSMSGTVTINGGGMVGVTGCSPPGGCKHHSFTNIVFENNTVSDAGTLTINGGGILGVRNFNNATFSSIAMRRNTVDAAVLKGGGILGIFSGPDNLTFSTITLDGNNVTVSSDPNGGLVLGIYGQSNKANNNVFTHLTIANNTPETTAAADAVQGGLLIGIQDSDTNTFLNATIYNNTATSASGEFGIRGGGILGLYGPAENSTFTNFTVYNNTVLAGTGEKSMLGIESSVDNSTFTNLNATGNTEYMIYDDTGDSYVNYFTYSNAHGIINWTNTSDSGFLKNLTLKGNLTFGTVDATSKNILINNNTAFVNTSAFSLGQINSEANITLYELDEWGFVNPVVKRNGVTCDSGTDPSCHAYTDLDADPAIFNVSGWGSPSGNFTVAEATLEVHSLQATDPVNLIAEGYKTVWCNATATDQNGWQDVDEANATLFIAPAAHSSADDNDDHYTNSSCTVGAGSGYNAPIICSFRVAWHADDGEWTCNITVNSTGDSGWGNKTDITVNQLLSLNVTDLLDFGSLSVGETSGDETLEVNNTGNVQIDIQVNGTDMDCHSGTIDVSQIHYNESDSVAWASMCELTTAPADTCPAFSSSFNLADGAAASKETYWKLQVPESVGGSCSGWLTVQATAG